MSLLREPENVDFSGRDPHSRFVVAEFAAPGLAGNSQRTYWAWSADCDQWDAPPNPRVAYASESHLFKMYVTVPLQQAAPGEPQPPADPEVERFIKSFVARLPELLQAQDAA
jgi:hypothetical protein